MLIRRMTATFGKLQNQTIRLCDGLNIIQAPNETGKSTWCSFILAMLYGINSRERDKAGTPADKNRYAPWSGAAMSGKLDIHANGHDITLLRTTRRAAAPMGEFKALYTNTVDVVPHLSSTLCGEQLLGVTKEVYSRSAFIRQNGLAISQDTGLERRIASLITTGEEGTSYSEAANTLKKQLNCRRHNKTGQIPVLESELLEIEQRLVETDHCATLLVEAQQQTDFYALRELALKEELAQHDRWETVQQQKNLAAARAEAAQAEQTAATLRQHLEEDRIPENENIGRLRGALVNLETTRKNLERSRKDKETATKALLRAEAILNESPFAGKSAEDARQEIEKAFVSSVWSKGPILFWLLFALIGTILFILWNTFLGQYFGSLNWSKQGKLLSIPVISLVMASIALLLKHCATRKRTSALTKQFGTADKEELLALVDTYNQQLTARESAQFELDRKSAETDTLYNMYYSNQQGILLEIRRFAPAAFDVSTADALLRECAVRRKAVAEAETAAQNARMRYEVLSQNTPADFTEEPVLPPERSREAVISELVQVQADLSAAHSAVDRLSGQLSAMGDPMVLSSTAEQIQKELAELEEEYFSILMAMETLDAANQILQNRFAPALGQRTAQFFNQLTQGRYQSVVLDRNFRFAAEPADDHIYRNISLLSAGAADQLYLAARLAICETVLPPEHSTPLILDDALANFDDERCAAALRLLKELSRHRQILLFTCHNREAAFFAEDKEVTILQLTNRAEKV